MPNFRYEGVTQSGKRSAGTVEAVSEAEARISLRKTRLRITAVTEKKSLSIVGFSGSVRLKDASAFTRQLASMNSSAIPLVESLDAIAEQTQNKTLRSAVRRVSSDVQSGVSLAESLARHPRIFNRLYCAMVRTGEAAGILSEVLQRLADYQEKAVAVRRRVLSAFAYPALVLVVAAGVMAALMTLVVPTFSSMLSELGAQLPLPTRIVIRASEIVKVWLLPSIAVAAAGLLAVSFLYKRNNRVRRSFDKLSLAVPLFGDLQKKGAVSRFSRTFGALLSGGVPIAEALEITANTAGNSVIEHGFRTSLEAIRGGRPLAAPLRETGLFPAMVVQMIAAGEKSGKLPEMLQRISAYYDAEVDTAITTLTSILEPALIVIMGLLISLVLVSMYLPMFEMVNAIG